MRTGSPARSAEVELLGATRSGCAAMHARRRARSSPPQGQLPSAAFSEPVCVGGAVLRNCRRDPQLHRPILCQLDASDRVSGWASTADQGCHSTAPPQWAQISHGVLICITYRIDWRSRILSAASERGWPGRQLAPTSLMPPRSTRGARSTVRRLRAGTQVVVMAIRHAKVRWSTPRGSQRALRLRGQELPADSTAAKR